MTVFRHLQGGALLIVLLFQIPLGLVALYWTHLGHTERMLLELGQVRLDLLHRADSLLRQIETRELRDWSSRKNTIPFQRAGVYRRKQPIRFQHFDWSRQPTLKPARATRAVIEFLGVHPPRRPRADLYRITVKAAAPHGMQQTVQSVYIRYWRPSGKNRYPGQRVSWIEVFPKN